MAGSVALGSSLMAAAADAVPVYVATEPLVPGDPIDPDSLAIRQVRLAESLDHYLRADEGLPGDLVVVRAVSPGELVARSDVSSAGDLNVRPVGITPSGPLPTAVVEGSSVDLWFVPAPTDDDATSPGAPYELAHDLTVAQVSAPTGGFAVGSRITVHVLVPVDDLADVLAAVVADGSVEVVPVPGAAG